MYIIPIPFNGPKIEPSKSYMILNKDAFLYEEKLHIYKRESSCLKSWFLRVQNIDLTANMPPNNPQKNPQVLRRERYLICSNLFSALYCVYIKNTICKSCTSALSYVKDVIYLSYRQRHCESFALDLFKLNIHFNIVDEDAFFFFFFAAVDFMY